MKYLHTMVRVTDLEASLEFYCQRLGMVQVSRRDYEQGQFTTTTGWQNGVCALT